MTRHRNALSAGAIAFALVFAAPAAWASTNDDQSGDSGGAPPSHVDMPALPSSPVPEHESQIPEGDLTGPLPVYPPASPAPQPVQLTPPPLGTAVFDPQLPIPSEALLTRQGTGAHGTASHRSPVTTQELVDAGVDPAQAAALAAESERLVAAAREAAHARYERLFSSTGTHTLCPEGRVVWFGGSPGHMRLFG